MSTQSFSKKFSKERFTLERAIAREVILPLDKPKLWKKILKYFEESGVQFDFCGEVQTDYITVLYRISDELGIPVLI
jgi:hypothetical protein